MSIIRPRFRSRILLAILLAGLILLALLRFYPFYINDNKDHDVVSSAFRLQFPSIWWNPLKGRQGCSGGRTKVSSDVDTADIYPKLDFSLPDNIGTGFWNMELEERYRKAKTSGTQLPLEVIIVPQSHVDPGWLRTYDDYFENSVSRILNNMVEFLNKTEEFKFIWSEISYFSTWWQRQSKDIQDTVKKILQRNQLEIVTGGWVMTDEATTHYFAIIDQLIEGHQWMKHFINTTVEHAWSVDVFGHSASLPYILSSSGIKDMVILRAHYAWKSFLAKTQQFDFYWEQAFDESKILCHMAPSDLYSFKHTCGPDTTICLQYDFRHVHGELSESTAVDITDKNVEKKADYLLAQYSRYASLYPHNVLLVPLGDDFRFNVYIEWVKQFENYKKLMNYINGRKDWNAHIRFGTVSDYFREVNKRLENNLTRTLPTLRGDFFPYADIYADFRPSYWTGFYSTRPFYKRLSMELEYWLRTTEILYSFAKTLAPFSSRKKLLEDYLCVIFARQNLALFQHHDAITGTSKANVMIDYGQRMHSSIIDIMSVTSHIAQFLMIEEKSADNVTWTSQIFPDTYRPTMRGFSQKLEISIVDKGRKIVLFNSLTKERSELIRLRVKSPYLKVLDVDSKNVPIQMNPVWNEDFTIESNLFELIFVANLKPLTLSTYTLKKVFENETELSQMSEISIFYDNASIYKKSVFKFKQPFDKHITLESSDIRARFTSSGHIKDIYMKHQGVMKNLNINFMSYVPKKFESGGYLFRPLNGNPVPINNVTDHYPLIYAIHGPIVSEVTFVNKPVLKFTVQLFNHKRTPIGLHLKVDLDITKAKQESEMVMQIQSDVKNKGVFFTDSNNFQMLKRSYVPHLPVQGNYYPATSAIFIEDEDFRLNLLIPYSHGVSSPNEGLIEIMLDRRMLSDDGRGMSEGVEDNQLFSTSFWLLPEVINGEIEELPCLSNDAHLSSLLLLHPVVILLVENTETELIRDELSFLPQSWPANTHLVNLRTLPSEGNYTSPSNDSLMVVCNKQASCKTVRSEYDARVKELSLTKFSEVKVEAAIRTTLTGAALNAEDNSASSDSTRLYTYKISFR